MKSSMLASRQVNWHKHAHTIYQQAHTQQAHQTRTTNTHKHKYTNTQTHSTSRARSTNQNRLKYKSIHIDHSQTTQQSLYNKQYREITSHTVQHFTRTLHVHNFTSTLQVHYFTRAIHTQIDSNHNHSLPICRSGIGRHRSWQTRQRPAALKSTLSRTGLYDLRSRPRMKIKSAGIVRLHNWWLAEISTNHQWSKVGQSHNKVTPRIDN